MHTGHEFSHNGTPTTHCVCFRSDDNYNYMKIIGKLTCLFFDQVNIYGKFCCVKDGAAPPSTELSTDIVDNIADF